MGKRVSSGTGQHSEFIPNYSGIGEAGNSSRPSQEVLGPAFGLGADSNCKTTRRGSRHRSVARTETFTAFRPLPDLDTWIAIFLGLQDCAGFEFRTAAGLDFCLAR